MLKGISVQNTYIDLIPSIDSQTYFKVFKGAILNLDLPSISASKPSVIFHYSSTLPKQEAI